MEKEIKTINLSLFKSGLIAYGLAMIVSQIILMRELVAIFYGNELSMGIMLAVWLFWTAIGSGIIGKFFARRRDPVIVFATLQLALAGLFPITLYLNRISPRIVNLPVGEITGLVPILLIPAITLSLFCLCAGALFTVGCRIYSIVCQTEKAPIGKVYLLEAIGAATGGALASFFLLYHFSAYENAAFLGAIHLAFGLTFLLNQKMRHLGSRLLSLLLSFTLSLPAWLFVTQLLEKDAFQRYWENTKIVKSVNSIYGTLTVTALENTYSFYQNGLLISTVPDLYYAEEAVHLALLQHEAPETVLLIGGGIGGSLQQILAHKSVRQVDYVELDPELVKLARECLPESETRVLHDSRVRFHFLDGRLFLKKSRRRYDVIISNLPDPSSTMLNRLYTVEFFQEVRQKLRENGVFGFQISSAENYITGHLAQYISSIYYTLGQAFEEVVIIPGITNYLLAAPSSGVLTEQAEPLITRMHQRQLQPAFVNEYYLPFRMSTERTTYLKEQIQQVDTRLLNRDFKPVAYFFDMLLWSGQSNPGFRDIFDWIAQHAYSILGIGLLLVGAVILFRWHQKRVATALASSVMLAGFTQIGLEVNLILAFQVLYGYAYYLVALIVAGFMTGMTGGSWLAGRSQASREDAWRKLLMIQIALMSIPFILAGIFYFLSQIRVEIFSTMLTELLFFGLAIMAGFGGGYQFPVASEIAMQTGNQPEKAGGTLYGFDLFGACLGAVLTSAFLVPLFGIYQTLFLCALLNALGLGLIILTYRTGAKISVSRPATPLPE